MVDMRGMMINRLIVLLQIFIFPTFFYLWAFLGPMKDMSLDSFIFWSDSNIFSSGNGDFIILKIVAPLIFALPFTLASIVRANKISNSYELMWRALGKVRIDTKLFYMVNAIFCLFFFILPFGSPIIAVFGAFFAVKLLLYAFGVKKNIPAILIVIPGLLLAAIPLMVTIAFYAEYATVIQPIWEFWVVYSEFFYGVVLCLACAMAIANFFIFLREGAAQVSYTKPAESRIGLVIKFFLFGGFLLIFIFAANWNSSHLSMFIINGIAVALSLTEMVVRWRKKMTRDDGGGGILMVPIFIAVNFIASYWGGMITLVVAISASVFFILFAIAYRYAEDETLFE
ncbi:MAG: hypothetical protein KGD64_00830 [Candidatus Heimdallarchaeota archaeon]|nr:hypothetical protein [Candidatus Heimdallarchaeota archaeon]